MESSNAACRSEREGNNGFTPKPSVVDYSFSPNTGVLDHLLCCVLFWSLVPCLLLRQRSEQQLVIQRHP